MKRITLILTTILISTHLTAQNGWNLILQNDHIAARKSFEKSLEKDSLDESALEGLIFLSSVEEDQQAYKKYAGRLVRKNWDKYYFNLFPVRETEDKIISNNKLNFSCKTQASFDKAYDLRSERKFAESQKIFDSQAQYFNWSYIGPFKNINQYGYIEQYPVETDDFDPEKTYTNDQKQTLKWVSPEFHNRNGFLLMTDFVPEASKGGVFYARTAFENTETLNNVRLCITRHYPVKIWVDRKEVYADPETIGIEYDNEVVTLNLSPGKHEILVKYAIGTFFTGMDGGSSNFNFSLEDLLGSSGDYDLLGSFYTDGHLSLDDEEIFIRLLQSDALAKLNVLPASEKISFSPSEKTGSINNQGVNHFLELSKNNPDHYFYHYCLLRAGDKAGLLRQLEPYFVNLLKQHPDVVFYKYLAYECLSTNGKSERADRLLSEVKQNKTPVMLIYQKQLKEIDAENEPEAYLAMLQKMHQLSPSNLHIQTGILEYYQDHGLKEERKEFAKEMIKKYPEYKYDLEDYLEDQNKPTDRNIGNKDDYSTKDRQKEAAKNIKKYFYSGDYDVLIKKYKGEENHAKVLSLYDEYLSIVPYSRKYRLQKAEFLFNIDKQQEALKELDWLMKNYPYDSEYPELAGDVYMDLKNDQEALKYYLLAKSLKSNGGFSYYDYGNTLGAKITRITGPKQLKNKFKTRSWEEIQADTTWKSICANEESVVTAFTTDVYLEEDNTVHMYSKMVIDILTEAGANSWTQYDFGFLGELNISKIIKKNGQEVQPSRSGGMIVFKNLEPGDRIRLEGSADWPARTELGKYFFQFNILSAHAPVHYAKLEIAVPENEELTYLTHHIKDVLVKTTEDHQTYYKWEYNNIPKSVEEEAVVDRYDMFSILQTGTLNKWEEVVDWYEAKTYRKTAPNYELIAVCDSIIKPGMSDQEKVVAIYNYITKDINYSFTQLLQSNYIPRYSDLTISGRIGDCKDVATLMISMLRHVGIESYYVLVKTNSYFHMQTIPGTLFDHVITAYVIDGKMNFLDLTTNQYPYYVLNENDLNAWALLIKPGENQLFRLPQDHIDSTKNMVVHTIDAVLTKDKTLKLNVNSVFPGLEGGYLREIHYDVSKENFQQELNNKLGKGGFENLSIDKSEFSNLGDFAEPLEGNFNMTSYNYADHIMNIHFMRIPFMNNIRTSTVVSGAKRFNTIDLTDITETAPCLQKITLTVADGASLMNVPKNIELKSKYGVYRITFRKLSGNKIYIEKYQQFYTTEIPAEEFESFKEFYLKLLEFDRTKIAINT